MIFEPVVKVWQLINQFEFSSLFVLIFLEEGGVPLPAPGDLFVMNIGRRSPDGWLDFFRALWVVTLATLLGSSFLYFLARRLGRKLVLKHLRFLHISHARFEKVEGWFQNHGGMVLIVGRLVPGFRIITTLVAGFFKIPYLTFVFYTTLATLLWATIYFFLGRLLGNYYHLLFKFLFREHPYLTYPFIILLAFFLARFLYQKARARLNNRGG